MSALIGSAQDSSGTSAGALTLTVVLAVLGSGFLATVITTVVAGVRATSSARRDGYAAAIEAVVAWCEYPYRVRRRTNDDPATLAGLADLGHDLQERLARHGAWVSAENSTLGRVFEQVTTALKGPVGLAIAEAWNTSPVETAQGMNVAPFGPGDLSLELNRLHVAVAYRFGMRRVLPPFLVNRRLQARFVLDRT